jgi:hypothetical protein
VCGYDLLAGVWLYWQIPLLTWGSIPGTGAAKRRGVSARSPSSGGWRTTPPRVLDGDMYSAKYAIEQRSCRLMVGRPGRGEEDVGECLGNAACTDVWPILQAAFRIPGSAGSATRSLII